MARREGVVAVILRRNRMLFVERGESTPHPGVRRQPDGTWKFAIDDPFGRG